MQWVAVSTSNIISLLNFTDVLQIEVAAQQTVVMAENSLGQIVFEMNNRGFDEQLFIKIASDFKKELCNTSIKTNTSGNGVIMTKRLVTF